MSYVNQRYRRHIQCRLTNPKHAKRYFTSPPLIHYTFLCKDMLETKRMYHANALYRIVLFYVYNINLCPPQDWKLLVQLMNLILKEDGRWIQNFFLSWIPKDYRSLLLRLRCWNVCLFVDFRLSPGYMTRTVLAEIFTAEIFLLLLLKKW